VVNPLHAGDAYVSCDTTTARKTACRPISVMPCCRSTRSAYSDCALSLICSDADRWFVTDGYPENFQHILTRYAGQWLRRCCCCSPSGISKYDLFAFQHIQLQVVCCRPCCYIVHFLRLFSALTDGTTRFMSSANFTSKLPGCNGFVLSSPVCKLKTRSRHDKTQFTPHFETGQNCTKTKDVQFDFLKFPTVLNCLQYSVHTADTDKTRQSSHCPCWRCELGITPILLCHRV